MDNLKKTKRNPLLEEIGDGLSFEVDCHGNVIDDTIDFFNGLKENSSLKSI
jgi:hypothetical protein